MVEDSTKDKAATGGARNNDADRKKEAAPHAAEMPRPDGSTAARPHEVRAGPGDAGAQDAPEVLPKTPRTPKASLARIVLWFVVPLAVLLALYWAMST